MFSEKEKAGVSSERTTEAAIAPPYPVPGNKSGTRVLQERFLTKRAETVYMRQRGRRCVLGQTRASRRRTKE